MKLINKIVISFTVSLIMLIFFTNISYGKVTYEGVFTYKNIADMIGLRIDQNGRWDVKDGEKGWSSCTQANNDSGYSSKIVTVYETFYDNSQKKIVANSIGVESGAKTYAKVTSDKITKLAAALSIERNVKRSKTCFASMCKCR